MDSKLEKTMRKKTSDVLDVTDLLTRAHIARGHVESSENSATTDTAVTKKLRGVINRLLYDSYDELLSGYCMWHTIKGALVPGLDTVIPELKNAGFQVTSQYVPDCDHAQLQISIRPDVLQCGFLMIGLPDYHQKDKPKSLLLSRYRRNSY